MTRAGWGPRVVVGFALLAGAASAVRGQTRVPLPGGDAALEVLHVRGPIYLFTGAGCNIVASVGPDGVLLVDPGPETAAETVLATLRRLQESLASSGVPLLGYGAETRSSLERMRVTPSPPKPIRYIVDTTLDRDHIGGNERISAAGRASTGGNVARDLGDADEGAAIYAHENVLARMTAPRDGQPEPSIGSLPRFTYRTEYYKLQPYVNGEGVQLIHASAAHTDGDTLVWFRGSDVLAAGDLFSTVGYPVIDLENGGSIQGEIDALNAILDLAFPEYIHQGGTLVIPGHGRIADHADVAYYRDMVTIIRDRVQDMVARGMTLEQVKAARPTEDYDPRYGSGPGGWTAEQFVEAVYKSLTAKR
jgi:glyoxylase-like metal-dependent hydrolase (beta-lactamase superfamily II)